MKITVNKLLNIGLLIALIVTILILAKKILIPIVFALLFSIVFLPIVKKLEKWGVNQVLSIIITISSALLLIVLIGIALTYFVIDIYADLPKVGDRIAKGSEIIIEEISKLSTISSEEIKDKIRGNFTSILSPAISITRDSVKFSILAIGNTLLVILYTFLLLNYRQKIKKVLFKRKDEESVKRRVEIVNGIKDVVNGYFSGMLIVMVILSFLNSISLWIIGVDYPFFWGILAGFLVIIPYIGTILGGTFPLLYSLATSDSMVQPILILVVYVIVQQIEGNFITPKILGSRINFNMMTIIIAMFFGALIWGIPGLIISVPVIGVLHKIFMHYEDLEPIGELMGSN